MTLSEEIQKQYNILKDIDNAIRWHYFECQCPKGCSIDIHKSAILDKIIKIVNYKSSSQITELSLGDVNEK